MLMVKTRSQNTRTETANTTRMEGYSDNESECSLPEVLSRDQMNDADNEDLLGRRTNSEQSMVDQRFLEMNRLISDLTSLVLALTEKISSTNREGNGLLTASNAHATRSDSL